MRSTDEIAVDLAAAAVAVAVRRENLQEAQRQLRLAEATYEKTIIEFKRSACARKGVELVDPKD